MARIVVNKHTNAPSGITQGNFVNPGEIVISNLKGEEDIYVINSKNEPTGIRKAIEGELVNFSGAVIDNYYTKEDVNGIIADTKSELNGTIEQTDENVRAYIGQEIEAVEGDIEAHYSAATAYTNTVSGYIETVTNDLYARIANLSGASSASYESVIGMIADVSAATRTLSGNVITLSGAVVSELSECFNGAEYVSTDKKIYFKHDDEVLAEINAADFIKDGMVSAVTISGDNLVIVFNTDAGAEPINIPLSAFFDSSKYYTKDEIDTIESGLTNKVIELSGATIAGVSSAFSYTNEVSGYIENRINSLENEENAKISGLSATVETFSAATIEYVKELSGDVINYVDEKLSGQSADISALAESFSAFSGYVENNYATSAATISAITAVSGDIITIVKELSGGTKEGISSAFTYTNEVSGKIETRINELEENVNEELTGFSETISELSGATIAGTSSAFSYTNEVSGYIENRINELETATLSAISETSGSIINYINEKDREILSEVSGLSGTVIVLNESVESAVTALSGNVISSITTLSGDLITYVNSAITEQGGDLSELSGRVTTLSGAVETLSGDILTYTDEKITDLSTALSGVSAATVTAVQNVKFSAITEGDYTIEQNGIKVKKDGTDIIIDVSDMIIGGDDYE